jgi:hypothetical protein
MSRNVKMLIKRTKHEMNINKLHKSRTNSLDESKPN